jgi:hypothetical protein
MGNKEHMRALRKAQCSGYMSSRGLQTADTSRHGHYLERKRAISTDLSCLVKSQVANQQHKCVFRCKQLKSPLHLLLKVLLRIRKLNSCLHRHPLALKSKNSIVFSTSAQARNLAEIYRLDDGHRNRSISKKISCHLAPGLRLGLSKWLIDFRYISKK